MNNPFSGKRFLIAGGAGFIGTNLCLNLLRYGADVLCIDDLLRGIELMMQTNDNFTGSVNLGNPEEYTILQLAQKISGMVNSQSKIVYKLLPQDDPLQRKPNISLAKKNLGWKPSVSVDEGVKKTIEYFEKRKSINEKNIFS